MFTCANLDNMRGVNVKSDRESDLAGPATLRGQYSEARDLLSDGNVAEAKPILRNIFEGRVGAFGEEHLQSQHFIDDLLDGYCKEYPDLPLEKDKIFDSSLIDDLINFCLTQEAYEEVDTLVQECVFPRKDTSASSGDDSFRGWDDFEIRSEPRVQARLASYRTPLGSWYWEDSRTYFCTWDQVHLKPGYPKDPFPRAPVRILVSEDGLTADISERFLDDNPQSSTDTSTAKALRESEIWHLLDSKRLARDWKILLAFGMQKQDCKNILLSPANHEFWLFWEDVIPTQIVRGTIGIP